MLAEPFPVKNVEPFLSQFRNCDKRVYGICPGVDEARKAAVSQAWQAVLDTREDYFQSQIRTICRNGALQGGSTHAGSYSVAGGWLKSWQWGG